jgi:hypothetical protein
MVGAVSRKVPSFAANEEREIDGGEEQVHEARRETPLYICAQAMDTAISSIRQNEQRHGKKRPPRHKGTKIKMKAKEKEKRSPLIKEHPHVLPTL